MGSSPTAVRLPRREARIPSAQAAAPLASMTVSGMSFGPPNAPHTNTPSREVWTGFSRHVWQKPFSSSSMPRLFANRTVSYGGARPTARTTISNSSSTMPPSSRTYLINRFFVCWSSLMVEGMERM